MPLSALPNVLYLNPRLSSSRCPCYHDRVGWRVASWRPQGLIDATLPGGEIMRVVYVIVALVAALASANGIRANVTGSDSSGVSLKSGHYSPAIGTDGRNIRSQPMARED